MSLEILGRSHDGEAVHFTTGTVDTEVTGLQLRDLRSEVIRNRSGIVRHNGVALDESDVTTLIGALSRDLPLWPLEACTYGDADATEVIEDRSHCAAHAAGFRMAEAESERAS